MSLASNPQKFNSAVQEPSNIEAVRQRSKARLRILLTIAGGLALCLASYGLGAMVGGKFERRQRILLEHEMDRLQHEFTRWQETEVTWAIATYRQGEAEALAQIADGRGYAGRQTVGGSAAHWQGYCDHMPSGFDNPSYVNERLQANGATFSESIAKTLNISFARHDITDADLQYLPAFHNRLISLDLTGQAGVTDGSIKYLQHLRKLKTLRLEGTQFTPAGIAKLKAELPNCKFETTPAKK